MKSISMIKNFLTSRIRRHEACLGFMLWQRGQRLVELWYMPRGYCIVPHSHPKEHVETIPIFGFVTMGRKNPAGGIPETLALNPLRWFQGYSIPPGWVHWFQPSKYFPFIFINNARWLPGVTPTSTADDFEIYGQKTT